MIPKVFHQYWSENNFPVEYERYRDSWLGQNPDWDLMSWTPDTLPVLRTQAKFDNPDYYSHPNAKGQFRSNLARLDLLVDIGGVWIDSDLECVRPIGPLLEDCEAFIGRDQPGRVQTAIMGAAPGHPFMQEQLAAAIAAIKAKTWALMSVHLANAAIGHHLDVRIFEPELFYPIDRMTGEGSVGNAYAIHHPRAVHLSDLKADALAGLMQRGWDGR